MLFVHLLRQISLVRATSGQPRTLLLTVIGLLLSHSPAWVQMTNAASESGAVKSVATASPLPIVMGSTSFAPQWNALSAAQRKSLRPLAGTWDTLGDGHKRKWIALAKSYPTMASAEQAKLHSRMAEWAALNPRERELARLNFVETKKLSPPDRASNWEAYKALSPEERRKLGKKATVKPTGAATTMKPVSPDKLAAVPVTRHTPQLMREMANSKQSIDSNTLLPRHPRTPPDATIPQN